MTWGDALTGAGVLIALAALLYTRTVSRRQADLAQQQTDVQARLTAIEEGRRADEVEARRHARVVPAFRRPEPKRLHFVLTNEGPAPARQVDCKLEALDGRQVPQIIGLDALPVELRPGQEMEFIASAALTGSTLMRAVVTWVDDAGLQFLHAGDLRLEHGVLGRVGTSLPRGRPGMSTANHQASSLWL